MEAPALLPLALLVIGLALASRRLSASPVTAPMLLVAAGALIGRQRFGLNEFGPGQVKWLLGVVELTLCIVVFSAGARAGVSGTPLLRGRVLRLVFLALPLTIGLGALAARLLWPQLAAGSALLAATIASATDSQVARPFFESKDAPEWARDLLETEGALADGLLLTGVWLALELAGLTGEAALHPGMHVLREVGLALIIGAAIGWAGGRLVTFSSARGGVEPGMRRLATFALAVLSWTVAARLGASGLTAAFVGGVVLARTSPSVARSLHGFVEEEGKLLLLVVFAVVGAVIVPFVLHEVTPRAVVWAALSLTVLRMLPVGLALARSGLSGRERAALGWMGPRGLPTLMLALVWREEAGTPIEREVLGAVSLVVLASIVVHGLTAGATARWLGRAASPRSSTRTPVHA